MDDRPIPEPISGLIPTAGLTLHHVAIAVESISAAAPLLEAVTGASRSERQIVEDQGVELCFIGTGPGRLELLRPLQPDTPVGRFLARRGSGLHHLAYQVDDLVAALRALEDAGFDLIDREPRRGAHGHRIAFLHPRSTAGVLIELVEV